MKAVAADSRHSGFILLTAVLLLISLAALALLLSKQSAMNTGGAVREHQLDTARYIALAGINHAQWQANKANCSGYSNLSNIAFDADNYSASFTPSSGSPVSISVTGNDTNGTSYTLQRSLVKVYQAAQQTILTMGGQGGDKDTTLDSTKPNANFGSKSISISPTSGQQQNALLYFDLSSIPSGVQVISAQLQLYATSVSNQSQSSAISLYRVRQNWLEGTGTGGNGNADGATWNTADAVINWSNGAGGSAPGGNYDPQAVSSTPLVSAANQWMAWPLEGLVNQWLNGVYPNQGLLLQGSGAFSAQFADKSAAANQRATLTLRYACECGQTCVAQCSADYTPTVKLSQFSTSVFGASTIEALTYYPAGITFNAVSSPVGGAWLSAVNSPDKIFMTDMLGTVLTSVASPISLPWGIAYAGSGAHVGQLAMANNIYGGVNWVNNSGAKLSTVAAGIAKITGNATIQTTATGTYDNTMAVLTSVGTINKVILVDQSGTILKTLDVSAFTSAPFNLTHIPRTDKLLIVDGALMTVIAIDFNGTKLSSYPLAAFGVVSPSAVAINPKTCDHVIADQTANLVMALNKTAGKTGTVTLSALADSYVSQTAGTTNYGTQTTLQIGRDNSGASGNLNRGLLQFDLSFVPVGATITAASLQLYQTGATGSGALTMNVYQVTAAWAENTVTWSNTGGGVYNLTSLASASVTLGTNGWTQWNLSVGIINQWLNKLSPNYGLLIDSNATKNHIANFASRENATSTQRPQLVLTYTMP